MVSIDAARRPGESGLDYHKRLVYGKLVDKTLAAMDYSEIAELVYGQQYASDVARRMLYGSRRTLELMDEEKIDGVSDADILAEIDAKRIELQKERQKFYDYRAAVNKQIRELARQEELAEILQDSIASGNLPQLNYEPSPIVQSDNSLLVSLNDMHYGANVANYWNTYNSDICRQMMSGYLNKILSVAEMHGSSECVVYNCGDVINGNIHYSVTVSNKENVIEQIKGAAELISEFLAELSKHFNLVRYASVGGNHSRLNPNKDMALKDERLDDLIEWYLAARLQDFENIIIEDGHCDSKKIDSTMELLTVRGQNYLLVHGDIDTSDSKIQSLQSMAQDKLYAVLRGHLHHNKLDTVQGVKVIMAGSFLGMDDFCVTKRIYGRAEQMICVCDDNGIVCHYDVAL